MNHEARELLGRFADQWSTYEIAIRALRKLSPDTPGDTLDVYAGYTVSQALQNGQLNLTTAAIVNMMREQGFPEQTARDTAQRVVGDVVDQLSADPRNPDAGVESMLDATGDFPVGGMSGIGSAAGQAPGESDQGFSGIGSASGAAPETAGSDDTGPAPGNVDGGDTEPSGESPSGGDRDTDADDQQEGTSRDGADDESPASEDDDDEAGNRTGFFCGDCDSATSGWGSLTDSQSVIDALARLALAYMTQEASGDVAREEDARQQLADLFSGG
jgi:hypothetical protein